MKMRPMLTPAQSAVLAVLPSFTERGISARQVAKAVWPDDPGWRRPATTVPWGPPMPLRAGRVLASLERAGYAWSDDRRWTKAPVKGGGQADTPASSPGAERHEGSTPSLGTLDYTCSCPGCWACVGYEHGCTCDVDWEKVRGR